MVTEGADTKVFRPGKRDEAMRVALNLGDDRIVLFCGKINKFYNLEVIVRAAPLVLKDFPNTKFLFVGDGNNTDYLKQLSEELRIEKSLIFTGFREPEDIPTIINLSDICVFSLPDSSALAIFEYMACAKSVVLPRGGTERMGISDRIIPEDCALRVDGTPEGFAQGINLLLNNEGVRKDMGRKARKRVIRLHDWDMLAEKYVKALKEVLH